MRINRLMKSNNNWWNYKLKRVGKNFWIASSIGYILLGMIIGLAIGYSKGVNMITKKAYPVVKTSKKNSRSIRDQSKKIIAPKDSDFTWNISQLLELKFGSQENLKQGVMIDDFIEKYGKAQEAFISDDRIALTWQKLDKSDVNENSYISAYFEKAEGRYYLESINYGRNSNNLEKDQMPADQYNGLKVGNPETGNDGVSYLEVLKNNHSWSIMMSAYQDKITHENKTKMAIEFKKISYKKTYKLTFYKQENGDYCLATKEESN